MMSQGATSPQGGATPHNRRRWRLRNELRILLRDGPVGYVRGRRALARFHESVKRLDSDDA